jgi:hypothetical protein
MTKGGGRLQSARAFSVCVCGCARYATRPIASAGAEAASAGEADCGRAVLTRWRRFILPIFAQVA